MHDVIPIPHSSDGYLFAASIACFAVAGVTNVVADGLGFTLGATGLAIVGVYGAARYAQSVSRQRLAATALGLWLAFLAVAAGHAVGLETIGSIAPGPTRATVLALTGGTWAALLAAVGTTIFLGFREYGSPAPADEQVLDGDASDYSTR